MGNNVLEVVTSAKYKLWDEQWRSNKNEISHNTQRLNLKYINMENNSYYKVTGSVSVQKDLANRLTDMVLLYNVATRKPKQK